MKSISILIGLGIGSYTASRMTDPSRFALWLLLAMIAGTLILIKTLKIGD